MRTSILFILIVLFIGLLSCEELQDPPMDKKHTSMFVKLSGNSGVSSAKSLYPSIMTTSGSDVYNEVNIDLLVIGAIVNDSLHSLFTNAGVYNLLDYTGIDDTLIASKSLPVGYLSQIRLVLGNNNSIKVNNEYYELKAPSGSQSGLKLNVHQDIYYDSIYTFILDFDVNKSIVEAGKKYLLKPVIKVNTISTPDITKTGVGFLY